MKPKDLNKSINLLRFMNSKYLMLLLILIFFLPLVHAEFISSIDQYATNQSICKVTTVQYIDDHFASTINDNNVDLSWWQKTKQTVNDATFAFKILGATGKYNLGYQFVTPDVAGWNAVNSPKVTNITFTIDSIHFNWDSFFNPTVDMINYTKYYETYNIDSSTVTDVYLFYPSHAWFEHDDVVKFTYCIYFDGQINVGVYNDIYIMPYGSSHKVLYTSYDGGDNCDSTEYNTLLSELNSTIGFISNVHSYSGTINEFFNIITEIWFILYWMALIIIIISLVVATIWLILYVYTIVRNSLQ
jgi:hypothetical protein